MKLEYNIYCDESCHLENDKQKAMVLGGVWCEKERIYEISSRLKEFKQKNNLDKLFELKWNKVSNGNLKYYEDVIDYFFDNEKLHFRAIVIPDKDKLEHAKFNQTHDDFYYKMYFDLLKVIFQPTTAYNIYIDIKDTNGQTKINKLTEVLRNSHYDFSKQIIKKIQLVRSHESELIQLTDLLIGGISYYNRGLNTSTAKLKLIEKIKHRSGYKLTQSTLLQEQKFNLFIWRNR